MRPVRVEEMRDFMKSMKYSAAGVDEVRLTHQNKILFDEITEWFNLFLLRSEVPRVLKRFRTTLIPKKLNPIEADEFRPISVGSMIRRLFSGMLSRRFNKLLHRLAQRVFSKQEGVRFNRIPYEPWLINISPIERSCLMSF